MALNLVIAFIYASLAWLLWWQAMPTLILRRTKLQAYGIWVMGMAMAMFMGHHMDLWLAHETPHWVLVVGDFCLIGAGVIELIRARRMGRHRWGQCPEGAT